MQAQEECVIPQKLCRRVRRADNFGPVCEQSVVSLSYTSRALQDLSELEFPGDSGEMPDNRCTNCVQYGFECTHKEVTKVRRSISAVSIDLI